MKSNQNRDFAKVRIRDLVFGN